MALCRGGGMGNFRFLFEAVPDLLPYNYFSEVEAGLWGLYLEEREKIDGRHK